MRLDITEIWFPDTNVGWHGEARIEFAEQPVRLFHSFELYPTDKGCSYTVEHRAKVKIPLIERKVEQYILDHAKDGFEEEVDFLQALLA